MRTIWKFPFKMDDHVEIEMPASAKILHVEFVDSTPSLWALIPDTEWLKTTRKFRIYGTGHEIMEDSSRLKHIGTFTTESPVITLVWHMLEVVE